jgi:alkanesulfonate monooxygenase SsuD/methylene tetrahydromethanopterin reductase-like flavin-dependent oxidoreductase (luciferase family)
MKIEKALQLLTPSSLDLAKQDWRRDPATWRTRFKARETSLQGDPDEVADTLEAYFEKLPKW